MIRAEKRLVQEVDAATMAVMPTVSPLSATARARLDSAIQSHVQRLAKTLLERQLFMATAESCTGGWIAQSLTAMPGSSAWFDSGFVTYSNAAKQRLLNVPAAFFAPGGPGAVSEETVLAMTAGAIANSVASADWGSEEKQVGTVWIAWQVGDVAAAQRFLFAGDREAVRLATVEAALDGLLQRLA